jgi:hypothetical protein
VTLLTPLAFAFKLTLLTLNLSLLFVDLSLLTIEFLVTTLYLIACQRARPSTEAAANSRARCRSPYHCADNCPTRSTDTTTRKGAFLSCRKWL